MTATTKPMVEIYCDTCGEPFSCLDYGVCLYDSPEEAREASAEQEWSNHDDKDYCSLECIPTSKRILEDE